MPRGRTWTEADDHILRRDFEASDLDLLAASMGRTKVAVSSRACAIGLSRTGNYLDACLVVLEDPRCCEAWRRDF